MVGYCNNSGGEKFGVHGGLESWAYLEKVRPDWRQFTCSGECRLGATKFLCLERGY